MAFRLNLSTHSGVGRRESGVPVSPVCLPLSVSSLLPRNDLGHSISVAELTNSKAWVLCLSARAVRTPGSAHYHWQGFLFHWGGRSLCPLTSLTVNELLTVDGDVTAL